MKNCTEVPIVQKVVCNKCGSIFECYNFKYIVRRTTCRACGSNKAYGMHHRLNKFYKMAIDLKYKADSIIAKMKAGVAQ